jgi:hypothetical protein
MDDLWQPTSGLLIAVVTAATAWINHKLKDLDRQVNNKGKHGRKESLYELVHKNDIIAEQQLGMLNMIDEKLGHTDELCRKTSVELEGLLESRKNDWDVIHQKFDNLESRIDVIEKRLP